MSGRLTVRRLVIACLALIVAATPAAIGLLVLGDVALVRGLPLPPRASTIVTGEALGPPVTPAPSTPTPRDDHGGDRSRGTSDDDPGGDHGDAEKDDASSTSGPAPEDSSGPSGGTGTSGSGDGSGGDHGGDGRGIQDSSGHGSDD